MRKKARLFAAAVIALLLLEMLLVIAGVGSCSAEPEPTQSRQSVISISKVSFYQPKTINKAPTPIPDPKPAIQTQEIPTDPVDLYNSYIDQICETYTNLDPDLIRAVVYTESRYIPTAKNYNGTCVGLMQISTKWHTARALSLGVEDLYDPYGNILVGCDLLSELVDAYNGDIAYALMVYNMGYSGANNLHSQGKVSSYALNILTMQQELKGGYM